MLVGQIHGISRKWLWAVPLFQKVRRIVSSNGPGDIGRHFAEISNQIFNMILRSGGRIGLQQKLYQRIQESSKMDFRYYKTV